MAAEECGFSKYPKIQDMQQSSKWTLTPKVSRAIAKAKWAVTEKIHGANMCFLLRRRGEHDEPDVLPCSRNKPLVGDAADAFFPFADWLAANRPALCALYRLVAESSSSSSSGCLQQLGVFGELFGGHYPHADVAPLPGVKPVQTGVWYAADVRFAVFDVETTRQSPCGAVSRSFLPLAVVLQSCKSVGLLTVPLLKVAASYQDAIDFDTAFASRLPAALGLPPLPAAASLPAEGVVIRPYEHEIVVNERGDRAVVKKKAPQFHEDRRFHQAQAPAASKSLSPSPLDGLRFEYPPLLTNQRVDAAISKLGPVDPADRPRLLELLAALVRDVLDELTIALPAQIHQLSAHEHRTLTKEIRLGCRQLINDYFRSRH